jgi:hypothetical protein
MARGKTIFFRAWWAWKFQNQDAINRYGAVQMFKTFCWNHRGLARDCGINYVLDKWPHWYE